MQPELRTVKLSAVIFDETVYPRKKHDPQLVQRYADVLDVIEAKGNYMSLSEDGRLVDGRHRHLAYLTKYASNLDRETTVLVFPVNADKDVFELACELNSESGWQMIEDDKRQAAIRMYGHFGTTQEDVAKKLHVGKVKVNEWLRTTLENERKEREAKMWSMYLACKTQEEIAEAVGFEQNTVSDFIRKLSVEFSQNDSDNFRNFDPEVYGIWNFGKLTNKTRVFGSVPQEVQDNLLYYYTKPFDVVFDPFGGGGSTIDVCLDRKRRYYVSDLSPIPARSDIRQWDITQGLPTDLPVPDLVFLDPPYWKQAAKRYSEKETDLGNLSLDTFLESIASIAKSVKRKWNNSRPNGRLALIIGEYKEDGKYVDLPFLCYGVIAKYLTPIRRIQVPYSTEVHGGAYVKKAKEDKEILYLSRDLMVFGVE